MTNDAQNALRRIIEKFTDNVRFCLICNYLSKIIPALQSRATRFRFGPLKEDQILPRLEHVCQEEKIKITEDQKADINNVVNWALNEDFSTAYNNIQELKTNEGLSLQDILTEVHLYVHRLVLPNNVKIM